MVAVIATGHVLAREPMHKDHKKVLIFGRAVGDDGRASLVSISINRVEFSLTHSPLLSTADDQIATPLDTCAQQREQIVDFTLEMSAVPEFDAECLGLAGDGAVLLIQANPLKYEIPDPQEEEFAQWAKKNRRYLDIRVKSNDDELELRIP